MSVHLSNFFELFGLALLMTMIVSLGFRSRKPKEIFYHRNRQFQRMFWVFEFFIVGLVTLIYLYFEIDSPMDRLFGISVTALVILTIVSAIYVLLTREASWRHSTGIEVIDERRELYVKGPEEIIGGGWLPALVLDGKPYQIVRYGFSNGLLTFNHDGEIVRDQEVMDKLMRILRLALSALDPDEGEIRAESYISTQKLLEGLNAVLPVYDQMIEPFEAPQDSALAKELEGLRLGFEILQTYATYLLDDWMLEAHWGHEKGWPKIKEVSYEEMLDTDNSMRAVPYIADHAKEMRRAIDAIGPVRKALRSYKGDSQMKAGIEGLLDAMHMADKEIKFIEKNPIEYVKQKYRPMQKSELKMWKDRLEWVERVDRWIAHGITGKDLEAQKNKWFEKKQAKK